MKRLPPEMRDWYFPFDWDLSKLWNLNVPTTTLPLSELKWHFDIPIWSKEKGMHFDLCPKEVIQNPGHHPRHDARIEKADISHPIEMMFTVDRLAILDGIHRLVKYEINRIEQVQVRIIPEEMVPLFAEK